MKVAKIGVPAREYFLRKIRQPRKAISDLGYLPLTAQEIAWKVYRLHFPNCNPWACHAYWNNDPENGLKTLDFYFVRYEGMKEHAAFVVEVAFYLFNDSAIVRWRNLEPETAGLNPDIPEAGETVVRC